MNHLDAIENESIYILREAFNLIERLGMLWSFGKDSNVLVWLTKRAFFGHVPFPVATIDIEKKMQEMCAFRDRYKVEWNLDLVVGTCPPIELIDPTLPPAARSARKTAALKDLIKAHGYNGLIAAIRRDEEGTRAKERVFSPRGEGSKWNFATSRRNSGTSTTMISRPAPLSTCIRSCIGPSATSAARTSPSCRSISPGTAGVIARSATRTSPSRSPAPPIRSTRSSPSLKASGRRAVETGDGS